MYEDSSVLNQINTLSLAHRRMYVMSLGFVLHIDFTREI